ncbi:SDR family oxidoreductase [Amylibacter sp.]|jgi:nucleoside-diphosphate-sugar epimerase|nr:SDR family oxidoreductase [Amylibacter sp.]MDA9369453.1 SDR family oxidoreductase [Amylibacter sp.]MDB4008273.1 SDR family oxidoreductase [Amylibacter sp.]MDB4016663.1 SDR family oxidoreductase [Amylibacter sp.]MDC0488148.1 SDR family oxidoreductase [Amylibacter sp.]|tara:strand:+ start:230 stop:1063 length:834 start_codon:yes stop_codon:yes gene_type:complete
MGKVLLSIGHGFSASVLGAQLIKDGWIVYGTTRSVEKAKKLNDGGVNSIIWPGTDLTPYIQKATHILTSVSPNSQGDPVLNQYNEILSKNTFDWVGYLSTTGVYGNHNGGWVDENSPLKPNTTRGKLREEAELSWSKLNINLHIFRLAGIYGPGRGPFSKVRNGTARRIIKEGQLFSRIHVDDIAQVLLASIRYPRQGAIYNVCDDNPAPPEDVISYAAELLDMPIPIAIDYDKAEMSPMARSFYAENKRVSNELIKKELGVELKFPDYKAGLQSLL